jgi:response regulator RpfG family c-di-GMP phosphodiesterase
MIKNINEHVEIVKKVILDERIATQQLKAMQESLLDKIEIATKESIELYREIEDTQKEVVFTLGMIAEERCNETSTHVKRVAEYSLILSRLAGLSEKEAHEVKYASPMHDIGKIGIPDAILKKSGKLTEEEFETMRSHATIGYEILKHSDKSILKSAAIIAHEHHEKYNGRGYPRGLQGEEIHIYARIVAIADVFDALGSDRIYKKAWPLEEIMNFFEKEKGEHFDPVLTNLFLSNIELFVAAREKINAGFEYIDRKIIEEEIKEKMRGEACA